MTSLHPAIRLGAGLGLAFVVGVWLVGCQPTGGGSANDTSKPTSPDSNDHITHSGFSTTQGFRFRGANDLLQQMLQTYHDATYYADAGQIRFDVQADGQPDNSPQLLNNSVTFTRPNRIRLQCLDAMLVSDGKVLRGSLESIPNQVLEVRAPEKLKIEDLFAGDALYDTLANGPAGLPIQLALLMGDGQLNTIVPEGSTPTLLGRQSFDGHLCERVKVPSSDGDRVYWIDAESLVLRMVELPTDNLRKQMEGDRPIKRLSVNIELVGASFGEKPPEIAFKFEAPTGVKLVKQLIGPPPPTPSELLGKSIADFTFAGIDGPAVTGQSIAGKVTVLDFWFTGCGPCKQSFPLLNQVYEKYKDSEAVRFASISIDDADVDAGTIKQTARNWGGQFPLARNSQGDAEKRFNVTAAPTLFVLDSQGVVQQHEVGLNPQLATDLPVTIDALLAGKSTWQAAKEREQRLVADYEQKIQTPAAVQSLQPIPEIKIAPADRPQSLKLTKRWAAEGLKSPGNILVVDGDGTAPQIFVMDGPRTVVEVDASGKTIARHQLPIPADAVVNFLRTAKDQDGKRLFVGSASGQQQLFLFDADWKLQMSFPDTSVGKHPGIGDVQFLDFTGQGPLQLAVGYWGQVGVQGVSLDGRRLWTDRSMEFVLRLAVSGPDAGGKRQLLCSNNSGNLVAIDSTGKPVANWQAAGLMIETALSAAGDEGQTAVCALGRDQRQSPSAVGFGSGGQELWRYPLPAGIFRTPIEPLCSGRALPDGKRHWLLPGADGSVHFVAFDGTPIDSFHTGAALTGLAGARFDDTGLLLIATASGLEAWQVEK